MIKLSDYTPGTLEEAITLITQYLSDDEITYIEETPEAAVSVHHGFGREIRNAWLWDPTKPLHQHFRTRFGLGHADDMSGLILDGVEARVKNKPFDPAPTVERYKKHWAEQGTDALNA